MSKTVRFVTLGCKVNQYDSEAMLERFLAAGYTQAQGREPADVTVVNTCTVTGTGDKKSLQLARRALRLNPEGELVLTGCLAQRMGERLRETGARLILGTQHRARVVELLEQAVRDGVQLVAVDALMQAPYEPLLITRHEGHTRAVMKIQEGCDNRCTYCIIPSVRGGVRSRPLAEIRAEAEALARAGFREIVLTGIHLTSYGKELEPKQNLADAIETVQQVEGVERIRLGSLEPVIASEMFVQRIRGMDKLCPQFHLALQSGSDAVLARMKRRYNTGQFRQAVQRLREAFPNASFTTDVIVGFPQETEAEFQQTIDFCREIGFLKLHVFPYSRREGTPAAEMDEQVPESEKERRVARLIEAGEALSLTYRQQMLGRVEPVLLEEALSDGRLAGYTPQYIRVETHCGQPGQTVFLRLEALTDEGMQGLPATMANHQDQGQGGA